MDDFANVRVREPEGGKNFGFEFVARSEFDAMVLNRAIMELNEAYKQEDKQSLNLFHQEGVTPEGANKVGYHFWEAWAKVDKEKLEDMLPEIDEKMVKARECVEFTYRDQVEELKTEQPLDERFIVPIADEIEAETYERAVQSPNDNIARG